jgi:PTS system nitrogen regulatory IIA component
MSDASNLLSVEDILIDLEAPTRKQVFEAAGKLFERRHGLQHAQVEESLAARERLGSTALGRGVAIPHARIKGLPRALAAFLRLATPVAFDAPDGQPVSDVLVLLVPAKATERHLQLLAEFAQMFSDRALREGMRRCASGAELHALLAAWTPA